MTEHITPETAKPRNILHTKTPLMIFLIIGIGIIIILATAIWQDPTILMSKHANEAYDIMKASFMAYDYNAMLENDFELDGGTLVTENGVSTLYCIFTFKDYDDNHYRYYIKIDEEGYVDYVDKDGRNAYLCESSSDFNIPLMNKCIRSTNLDNFRIEEEGNPRSDLLYLFTGR